MTRMSADHTDDYLTRLEHLERSRIELAALRRRVTELEQVISKLHSEVSRLTTERWLLQVQMEHIHASVLALSLAGLIISASPLCQEVFGYGDAIIGMPLQTMLPQHPQPPLEPIFHHVRETAAWQGQLTFLCADGSIFVGDVTMTLVCNRTDQPRLLIATIEQADTNLKQQILGL